MWQAMAQWLRDHKTELRRSIVSTAAQMARSAYHPVAWRPWTSCKARGLEPSQVASRYAELSAYWQHGQTSLPPSGVVGAFRKSGAEVNECGVHPCNSAGCALPLVDSFTCEPIEPSTTVRRPFKRAVSIARLAAACARPSSPPHPPPPSPETYALFLTNCCLHLCIAIIST